MSVRVHVCAMHVRVPAAVPALCKRRARTAPRPRAGFRDYRAMRTDPDLQPLGPQLAELVGRYDSPLAQVRGRRVWWPWWFVGGGCGGGMVVARAGQRAFVGKVHADMQRGAAQQRGAMAAAGRSVNAQAAGAWGQCCLLLLLVRAQAKKGVLGKVQEVMGGKGKGQQESDLERKPWILW